MRANVAAHVRPVCAEHDVDVDALLVTYVHRRCAADGARRAAARRTRAEPDENDDLAFAVAALEEVEADDARIDSSASRYADGASRRRRVECVVSFLQVLHVWMNE